jgi:hypothetical protein
MIDQRIGVVGVKGEQWSVGHNPMYDVICKMITKLSNEKKVWTRVSCYRDLQPSCKVSVFKEALQGIHLYAYDILKGCNPVYDVLEVKIKDDILYVQKWITPTFASGVLGIKPEFIEVDLKDPDAFNAFVNLVEEILDLVDKHTVGEAKSPTDPSHDRNCH